MLTANEGEKAQERMELLDLVGQACDHIPGEAGMAYATREPCPD